MGNCTSFGRCSGVRYVDQPAAPTPPPLAELEPEEQHCRICFEPDAKFPAEPPSIGCAHPVDVCVSCLETHVCTQIDRGALRMTCPSGLCPEQMEVDETLQATLGEKHRETFDRFCELQLRRKLNAEPDLVWCKASGCGSAQIHIGGAEYPVVVCHWCSARTCFTHDMPWHEGKTCEEFTKELKRSSRWKRETKQNDKWLKRNTKLCPGEGCGRLVEKRGGCDHMVCRPPGGCGHEFCWRCLAPYQPIRQQGKKLHKPNCRHYK